MKRLLVTGSRTWTDEFLMGRILGAAWVALEGHKQGVVLVHGGASGADKMADRIWRRDEGSTVETHPADWSTGKGAGFDRNVEMVELGADLCVAFLTPCSDQRCIRWRQGERHWTHGAAHCMGVALEAGICPVWAIGATP